MTTTDYGTPEHLKHHEYGGPFTGPELIAISLYENRSGVLRDCLGCIDLLAASGRTEANTTGSDDLTAEQIKSLDRANILACLGWLSEWYELLDSLRSEIRGIGAGPDEYSKAANSYLRVECIAWYRTLHVVRREACRWALGAAGPQPEVNAGWLTFFDIPGVQLDGTIAAESR